MGSQMKKLRRRNFSRVRATAGAIISSARSKHLADEGCWFDVSDDSIGWLTQPVPNDQAFRIIARCILHPRTEHSDREVARSLRNIHSKTAGDVVEHWSVYASPNPWGTATVEAWDDIYGLVERLSYDTGETRQRELPAVECGDGTLRILAFTWHSDATDVEAAVRRQLRRQIDGMVERMSVPVPPPIPLRPDVTVNAATKRKE